MKKGILTAFGVSLIAFLSYGQGVFVYDQQSAVENVSGLALAIQNNQPLGQSFTPTLDSVGFVRLWLLDSSLNAIGATIHVNLLTNSITGPVLASTDPVFMPDGFSGYVNFYFSTPVPLTPGTIYFLRPIVESGGAWGIVEYNYNYPGGTAFANGVAAPNGDLWFREGIIVPEPSAAVLILIGGSFCAWFNRRRSR